MTPFEQYLAPAGHRTAVWRTIVGLLLILLLWLVSTVIVLTGWTLWFAAELGGVEPALKYLMGAAEGGDSLTVAFLLSSFFGVWIGVWLVLQVLHGQPFRTVLAPDRWISWRDLLLGLGLAAVLAVPSLAAALMLAEPSRTSVDFGTWALWLLPLFFLTFIQAGSEELIFRGYLLQQLGNLSRHWVVWAGIPAFGFGLLHIINLPGVGGLYYVAVTTLMGLSFAVLVWRSGNLWSAIGLHLGNNLLGITVVGAEGVLSGSQLWLFPKEAILTLMPVDVFLSAALLLLLLSPVGRIFGEGR